jgi:hypothetical protein
VATDPRTSLVHVAAEKDAAANNSEHRDYCFTHRSVAGE